MRKDRERRGTVSSDGTIRGLDGDLGVLATMPSSVALKMPHMNDADFPYKANADHYRLKLQHILQAFLSPNHARLYDISFAKLGSLSPKMCCRIAVRKCADDDFVYCTEKYSPGTPVVDEIFIRIGNEKKPLQGRERDEFVRARWEKSMFVKLAAMRAE